MSKEEMGGTGANVVHLAFSHLRLGHSWRLATVGSWPPAASRRRKIFMR